MNTVLHTLLTIALTLDMWLFRVLALAALAGAVLAAITREDAFRAGDRMSKWSWVALLAGSAVALGIGLPFIAWAGAVVTGVYWFDVRPHLREIQNGSYGY